MGVENLKKYVQFFGVSNIGQSKILVRWVWVGVSWQENVMRSKAIEKAGCFLKIISLFIVFMLNSREFTCWRVHVTRFF